MRILIKNIILDGKEMDIFIEGNKIKKIGKNLNLRADKKIYGKGEKAALPGLINCHTHSAMILFRGYGDDLPLKEWLIKKIWPLEQKITEEDVYWGTKLACIEMIKTGTTTFNDMYWFGEAVIDAVKEMGLRTVVGPLIIDFDKKRGSLENFEKIYQKFKSEKSDLVRLAVAPHSIYGVSKENLVWAKDFAKKHNLLLHIHLSETEEEVKGCLKLAKLRPVEYLEKIGFLGENCILAHSIWLNEKEIEILAKHKSNVVYNPCSNMKLASGIFPYKKLKEAGVNITLGTDGAASNNSLDMFFEMKFGSLLQKIKEMDPTIAPAKEIFEMATKNGAKALKIDTGEIKDYDPPTALPTFGWAPGKLADLILINLNQITFHPGHNLISDIVYSAKGDCVSDVICNGKILMRDRKIEGEEKIKKEATKRAKNLTKL